MDLEVLRVPKKHTKILVMSLIILAIVFIMMNSTERGGAQGTCYQNKITCFGIPASESCIGYERIERDFNSADECGEISVIERECRDLGEVLRESNPEIGDAWKEKVTYEGITCKIWNDQYDIEISNESRKN